MDDLDQMSRLIDGAKRRARVLYVCWFLFLIVGFMLNMYCFLFGGYIVNGIASIPIFMYILYWLTRR